MADAPKPAAVIGTALPPSGRVVELVMVRVGHMLEGARVGLVAGPRPLGHGAFVRPGRAVVLALRQGEGGRVEALLREPLGVSVPGACAGDGVYFADEANEWAEREERAYVAAWKAGKEA